MSDAGVIALICSAAFTLLSGIIVALVKIFGFGRQLGRIEEGVSGLYERVEKLERHLPRGFFGWR